MEKPYRDDKGETWLHGMRVARTFRFIQRMLRHHATSGGVFVPPPIYSQLASSKVFLQKQIQVFMHPSKDKGVPNTALMSDIQASQDFMERVSRSYRRHNCVPNLFLDVRCI